IATGSEVSLAVEARARLERSGIRTRVVSMPCREWFEQQTRAYQDKVLPPSVRARVSIEAAVAFGWHDIVGDAGRSISLEHFGASADYQTLFREFGITPEATVKAARDSLKAAATAGDPVPSVNGTNPRKRTDGARTDTTAKKSSATKSAASASSSR
ncbi:MAG: transketolase, partial [Actinomycetota bacterium]|nr:transketolase [Actinomycetota bacterium]